MQGERFVGFTRVLTNIVQAASDAQRPCSDTYQCVHDGHCTVPNDRLSTDYTAVPRITTAVAATLEDRITDRALTASHFYRQPHAFLLMSDAME